MLKESFLVFTPPPPPPPLFCLPFFLELYEGAQRYTFLQSLYELKAQLGQQFTHAQTFDRGFDENWFAALTASRHFKNKIIGEKWSRDRYLHMEKVSLCIFSILLSNI